jgi:hypothetical protein
VTNPKTGYEANYDTYQLQTFPVRYYISDRSVGKEALTPQIRSRTSSDSSALPTEYDLLQDAFHDLKQSVLSKFDPSATTNTGVIVSNYTGYGDYDDWNRILSAGSNDTWVAGTRDATYGSVWLCIYLHVSFSFFF